MLHLWQGLAGLGLLIFLFGIGKQMDVSFLLFWCFSTFNQRLIGDLGLCCIKTVPKVANHTIIP